MAEWLEVRTRNLEVTGGNSITFYFVSGDYFLHSARAKSKDNEIKMKYIGVSGNTEPRYPDSYFLMRCQGNLYFRCWENLYFMRQFGTVLVPRFLLRAHFSITIFK